MYLRVNKMTIKDCINYKKNNISEEEVISVIQTYPLTHYIRENEDLYDDILWLLDKQELTYINPFKQKDFRTPNIIEAFSQFNIKLTGKESFVKLKMYERPAIKITLEIV